MHEATHSATRLASRIGSVGPVPPDSDELKSRTHRNAHCGTRRPV